MRKPAFCIGGNNGADQLRSNGMPLFSILRKCNPSSSYFQFLRLLKMSVAVFKCLRHLIKSVYSHNFASKTRLIYFSHFPEIFV